MLSTLLKINVLPAMATEALRLQRKHDPAGIGSGRCRLNRHTPGNAIGTRHCLYLQAIAPAGIELTESPDVDPVEIRIYRNRFKRTGRLPSRQNGENHKQTYKKDLQQARAPADRTARAIVPGRVCRCHAPCPAAPRNSRRR